MDDIKTTVTKRVKLLQHGGTAFPLVAHTGWRRVERTWLLLRPPFLCVFFSHGAPQHTHTHTGASHTCHVLLLLASVSTPQTAPSTAQRRKVPGLRQGFAVLANSTMRFLSSALLGGALAWAWRAKHDAAECYRSIQSPVHIKGPQRKGQVFSQRYEPYTLGEIIPITADTALFRFLLHESDDEFTLKPCSTLQACYKYGVQPTDQCQRFYTPVTANHTKGYFDLIVKRKTGGLMTAHLFGMHVGDKLLFRSVAFKIQYKPNRWKHVGMIAGGTGFTPMLQIIRHSLTEPWDDGKKDKTQLSFLFCNRTERHILLKGVFDQLAIDYAKRFRMFYAVDLAVDKEKWLSEPNHFIGLVTKEMVQASMPHPDEKNKIIMLCGPDALLNHVAGTPMGTMSSMSSGYHVQPIATDLNNLVDLGGILKELGYKNEDVYRF